MEQVKNLISTVWYRSAKTLLEIHLIQCFFVFQAMNKYEKDSVT